MNQLPTNNEPTTTIGCPSLGLPRIPSGADGVEPLKLTDYEQIVSDVFHKCNEAFINAPQQRDARPGYFKVVVGDLADALASVVPVEGQRSKVKCHEEGQRSKVKGQEEGQRSKVKGQTVESNINCLTSDLGPLTSPLTSDLGPLTSSSSSDLGPLTSMIDNLTPDLLKRICERYGLKKRMTPAEYTTVAEGCKLTRFKGTNATRLVAVRKGLEGNADLLYEISVDHDNATAVIERDGEMMYQIKTLGLSYRRCVHAAIQVLRSHLNENDGVHRRNRLSIKRKAEARLDAEPTAEDLENA